jgi:hypothetical protein
VSAGKRKPADEPEAAPPDAAGGKGSFTRPGEVLSTPREGAPDAQVEPQDPDRDPAPGEQARRASEAHPSLREDERPRRRADSDWTDPHSGDAEGVQP